PAHGQGQGRVRSVHGGAARAHLVASTAAAAVTPHERNELSEAVARGVGGLAVFFRRAAGASARADNPPAPACRGPLRRGALVWTPLARNRLCYRWGPARFFVAVSGVCRRMPSPPGRPLPST